MLDRFITRTRQSVVACEIVQDASVFWINRKRSAAAFQRLVSLSQSHQGRRAEIPCAGVIRIEFQMGVGQFNPLPRSLQYLIVTTQFCERIHR